MIEMRQSPADRSAARRHGWRIALAAAIALATYSGAVTMNLVAFTESLAHLVARMPSVPPLAHLFGPRGEETLVTLAQWVLGTTTFVLVAALLIDARRTWTLYGAWCAAVVLFYLTMAFDRPAGHEIALALWAGTWLAYVGFTGWAIRRTEAPDALLPRRAPAR